MGRVRIYDLDDIVPPFCDWYAILDKSGECAPRRVTVQDLVNSCGQCLRGCCVQHTNIFPLFQMDTNVQFIPDFRGGSVLWHTGGFYSVSQPTRLTIPTDGFYSIQAAVHWLPASFLAFVPQDLRVEIRYNGHFMLAGNVATVSTVNFVPLAAPGHVPPGDDEVGWFHLSCVAPTAFYVAGDYVEMSLLASLGDGLTPDSVHQWYVEPVFTIESRQPVCTQSVPGSIGPQYLDVVPLDDTMFAPGFPVTTQTGDFLLVWSASGADTVSGVSYGSDALTRPIHLNGLSLWVLPIVTGKTDQLTVAAGGDPWVGSVNLVRGALTLVLDGTPQSTSTTGLSWDSGTVPDNGGPVTIMVAAAYGDSSDFMAGDVAWQSPIPNQTSDSYQHPSSPIYFRWAWSIQYSHTSARGALVDPDLVPPFAVAVAAGQFFFTF